MTPELIFGLVGLLIGILSVGAALAWLIRGRTGKSPQGPRRANGHARYTHVLNGNAHGVHGIADGVHGDAPYRG